MKPLNKSLLPKYNKHTHKEVLDLTGPVNRIRMYRISPIILTIASFIFLLGFVLAWVPVINPFTMGALAMGFIGRFG